MSKSNYTIYQLNTDKRWQDIIDEFNKGKEKEEDKKFKIKSNTSDLVFENIDKYELYVRAAETKPDWIDPLNELVNNLGKVVNINNSFVLFFKVGVKTFVATAGQGYKTIEVYRNFNFGMEVLSRLIDMNENVIKRINDRYLSGNIVGGNYQYHRNISLSRGKEFNTYFSELYTALPSRTIEKKLKIKVDTKKKDYRFLAKDSIKLSKALSLNELDILLGAIGKLLEKDGYPINPISYLHKKDPEIKELDKMAILNLINYIDEPEDYEGVNVIPFFQISDNHYIQIGESDAVRYDNELDVIGYLKNMISFDKEITDLISIVKQVKLTAIVDGEEPVITPLYNHLEVNIIYKNKSYWLRDGNWLFLEREFDHEINDRFKTNITEEYNHDFILDELNAWIDKNEKEGNFNFHHNEKPLVYVLDKMLYNNIEICDLLVVQDNELFFVHVKNGLNGDVRILANQIETSMLTLSDGIHANNQILIDYYDSIIRKIDKLDKEGKETMQSIAARKFQVDFPDVNTFIDLLIDKNRKINFVFAYRPLDSYDFFNPETITSTPAKLAMLNLVKVMDESDFKLNFMKIRTKEEAFV